MGITGLLPFLEKSSKKGNISQFAGGTVAVDTYCWLHKGAFSCADKLVMGQATDAYVKYCMKYVQMLLDSKIKPILVFDGRHLQAKAETEVKRRESRKINRKKGAELMRMGNTAEGRNLLRRSLDITHAMALELIKECQQCNVDCIVAPYEADAQLAYLNISGIADVVITEDSDLTLFGCKKAMLQFKIFFKMDLNGNGVLVEQDRIYISMGVQPENFSMEKFRHMCILSGCDYLPSLPGIGLMKACKFISKIADCDIQKALPRMGAYLNMKSITVTKEYIDSFIKADVTFKHQLVFCPLQRKQVRLYPPSADVTEEQLKYAGEEMEDEDLAFQVALGNHDPFTLERLHDFDPDKVQAIKRRTNSWAQQSNSSHVSIWSNNFDVNDRKIEKKEKPLSMPNSAGKVAVIKPIIPKLSGKRPHEDFEEISDEDILQMYLKDINQSKSDTSSSGFAETESSSEPKSPVMTRSRVNPFKKHSDEDSPSYLSKGRKRCMLRFKPTVIDDSVVTQSKFFTKIQETENEQNVKPVENSENRIDVLQIETNEDVQIIEESACKGFSVLKMNEEQNDSAIENSVSDSVDFLKLHEEIVENGIKESNNVRQVNLDSDEYFCTQEISAKSNMFQWSNPKLIKSNNNIVKQTKTQRGRQSLTRQSSAKKVTAKKTDPIAGQSLLNQFGFQKRPSFKH